MQDGTNISINSPYSPAPESSRRTSSTPYLRTQRGPLLFSALGILASFAAGCGISAHADSVPVKSAPQQEVAGSSATRITPTAIPQPTEVGKDLGSTVGEAKDNLLGVTAYDRVQRAMQAKVTGNKALFMEQIAPNRRYIPGQGGINFVPQDEILENGSCDLRGLQVSIRPITDYVSRGEGRFRTPCMLVDGNNRTDRYYFNIAQENGSPYIYHQSDLQAQLDDLLKKLK